MSTFQKGASAGTFQETADKFAAAIGGLEHEELHALWLDADFKVISFELLAAGNKSRVEGPSAFDIMKRARELGARKFIITHNHPGTPPEEKPIPSLADIKTTIMLHDVLEEDGVTLLDHIVVGPIKGTSIVSEVLGVGQ